LADQRTNRNEPSGSGTVAVIGLGRFGQSVALELMDEGTEVLGIDADPRKVHALAGHLTHVAEADATDEASLRQLSVHELNQAVVGIGTDLEASMVTSSIVVDFGLRNVWAKAISHAHARVLGQLGVHHVVSPEHDMGTRVAHLVRGRMLDYIEFDDGYAIVKARPPQSIHGVPLGRAGVRSTYGVTIVGVKRAGEGFTHATGETVVNEGDLIIVSGPEQDVETFTDLA
jgi:trk system potassium uptake protein TrkA